MRLANLSAFVLAAVVAAAQVSAQGAVSGGVTSVAASPSTLPTSCPAVQTRYECRELPDTQRQALFTAIKNLQDSGGYDKYVDWHQAVASTAHGTPEFFTWHREYLRRIEAELGAALCYWDWASDAQVPEASPMFMPGWCGTNSAGSCISDNFWSSYQYRGQCVTTQWDGSNNGIGAFYSIDYVAKLIEDNSVYDTFRVAYEGTAHARIHNGVGDMFSKMTSPANPLFFFHHANVDRHWAIWQWANPNSRTDYPKPLSTTVDIFSVPVSGLMDTTALCYTYSNMDIINTGRAKIGLLQRRALGATAEPEIRELDTSDHLVRLNRRCGCGNVDAASNYAAPPCGDDRTNLVDLREVRPAPEWWIKMENLNCTEVRRHEKDHANYINTLNRIPGYVSPSALYNRPDLLAHVIKQAPADTKFYVYGPGSTRRHEVDMCETDRQNPVEAVQKLRKEVQKIYQPLPYDKLKDSLEKVVGCNLANTLIRFGNHHANRPYRPLPELEEQDLCPAGYDYVADYEENAYDDDDDYHRHHRHRHHHSRSHGRGDSRRRRSRYHRSRPYRRTEL